MMVSGLTILRDAVRMDYPFCQAIEAALPLCDEFIVVVGDCDDGTLEAVRAINDARIKIVETVWSPKVSPQKALLAQQTNIGLHQCRGDWAVYVQANEVLHEDSLPVLGGLMRRYEDDQRVEALLLERLSFWGDYGHVINTYPHRFKLTPRIVRPYIGTHSIRDGMGFAVFDGFSTRGRYPRSVDSGEKVYRYGMVLSPEGVGAKFSLAVHRKDGGHDLRGHVGENFFYEAYPKRFIERFEGIHPKAMAGRVAVYPGAISLEDPRWRQRLTLKEWQRLFESRYYARHGIPGWRDKRYRLVK